MKDSGVDRSRRVKFVASLTAALGLLSGALLLAEHDASAKGIPTIPTVVTPTSVALPAAPAVAQLLPANATGAQALFTGSQIANENTASAQAVTANQTTSPLIASIACATLLADRAAVINQFAALIQQFPAQTGPLLVQRNAALAIINANLALFGCPVPSGVALF